MNTQSITLNWTNWLGQGVVLHFDTEDALEAFLADHEASA